jgi:hypothetical protein
MNQDAARQNRNPTCHSSCGHCRSNYRPITSLVPAAATRR